MACPHVSGVAALIMGESPGTTPNKLLAKLLAGPGAGPGAEGLRQEDQRALHRGRQEPERLQGGGGGARREVQEVCVQEPGRLAGGLLLQGEEALLQSEDRDDEEVRPQENGLPVRELMPSAWRPGAASKL